MLRLVIASIVYFGTGIAATGCLSSTPTPTEGKKTPATEKPTGSEKIASENNQLEPSAEGNRSPVTSNNAASASSDAKDRANSRGANAAVLPGSGAGEGSGSGRVFGTDGSGSGNARNAGGTQEGGHICPPAGTYDCMPIVRQENLAICNDATWISANCPGADFTF